MTDSTKECGVTAKVKGRKENVKSKKRLDDVHEEESSVSDTDESTKSTSA